MAGTGRLLNPAASSPAKTAAHSSPSISRKCASPCTPREQPSFAKATVRVKAAAPLLAKSTISRSKQPKPTPPNAHWRHSANHLGLSSIGKAARRRRRRSHSQLSGAIAPTRFGFHPDDTTPIPRPSRYYGRRQSPPITEHFKEPARPANPAPPAAPPLAPAIPEPSPAKIDKSVLALAEPKRRRDKSHLRFVASQPCLVCGRHPSDPHHLRFAQPSALGVKVSDEFTVPLCRGIIASCIKPETKSPGGRPSTSMPCQLPGSFGSKPIPMKARPRRKLQVLDQIDAKMKANGHRETDCCKQTKRQEQHGPKDRIR